MTTQTTEIPAVIGHYSEPATMIDPSRLEWLPGFPSHDGETRLLWHAWRGRPGEEQSIASLHTAIVRDVVSHMVVDAPGVTHNENLIAEYGYVTDPRRREHESHHPFVAWRVVRDSDGEVVYDSLTEASSHWRVIRAGVPMEWGRTIRALQIDGKLPLH